jgi:hypothetical protein
VAHWRGKAGCFSAAPAARGVPLDETITLARSSPIGGTLAFAHGDVLYASSLDGSPPRKVADAPMREVFAVHGDEAIVVDRSDAPSKITAIHLADGKERLVFTCEHACDVAGVSRDGTLWFIDRNVPKFATVKSIPLKGGAAKKWPGNVGGWWSCYVRATLDDARGQLVLAVSNALGWPTCEERRQGIYIVPIQGRLAAPIVPKHPNATPVELARLDASGERLVFTRDEGGVTFSSKKDGTDVRIEYASPDNEWSLALRQRKLYALPPRGSKESPVPLVGPLPLDTSFALRR